MTISKPARQNRIPSTLIVVLVLLAISAFINYIDRGNLSIAAPLLKDELGISPSKLGIMTGVALSSAASWVFIVGPVEPVVWAAKPRVAHGFVLALDSYAPSNRYPALTGRYDGCYKILFESAPLSPPWTLPGSGHGVAANLRFRRHNLMLLTSHQS